jgi:hypothetical protein
MTSKPSFMNIGPSLLVPLLLAALLAAPLAKAVAPTPDELSTSHQWAAAVINLDAPTAWQELTGSDLMDKGLRVTIPTQPGAALFTYRKVK